MLKIKRALISVSDKTGLLELAKTLKRFKVEIISTGGTQKLLKSQGIGCKAVSEITGFPEIFDGRVKTLHPKIHGGLLYLRGKASHRKTAQAQGIRPIDLVIVNLYPFNETVQKPNVRLEDAIEQIDIGGPAMIRSGAKNHASVAVVTDPADYGEIIQGLNKHKGAVSEQTCARLACKAFEHTAHYDRAISRYLHKKLLQSDEGLPVTLEVPYERKSGLRYGENPHQRAALYQRMDERPRFSFEQLHGKELSYNNILDIDSVIDIMREFKEPCASIVKHNNPCGIALDSNLAAAVSKAVESDPLSAFGGIVGVNRPLDQETAVVLLEKLPFFEVIVAPKIAPGALQYLKQRKNLRVIAAPDFNTTGPFDLRFVKSGILLQDRDKPVYGHAAQLRKNLKVVTKRKPTKKQLESLLFAWSCAKLVRSNAIVLVQGKQTVGIGCGQMSRIDSVKLACEKAGPLANGSVMASDGFFPMPDNIVLAHSHHVKSIIQPGGSIRDQEVIDACNHYGIAMVFTGERHFKH